MHTSFAVPSEVEQAIIDEVNLARSKPREYAGYVHSMLSRTQDMYQGYEELFNVLRVRSPVVGIRIGRGLCVAAKKRAEAVANGLQSHEPGQDLVQRVSKYGKVEDQASLKEVVWVGRSGYDVRKIILSILADDSNPTRSRRTALLSATATVGGVACVGNVVCLIMAKGFLDGVSQHIPRPVGATVDRYYSSNHFTGGLDEPVQQKPVRQVMTPTHAQAALPTSKGYTRTNTNALSPGTPRLHEYEDIRKIMSSMPTQMRPCNGSYANNSSNNIKMSAKTTTNATTANATANTTAKHTLNSNNITTPVVKQAVVNAREEDNYNGVIIGLNKIRTTLAEDNGESNYVGFTTSLRDRVSNWLGGLQHPAVLH